MHSLRAVLDQTVGNGGALRNCRLEQSERMRAEAEVEQVRARIDLLSATPAEHRVSA